MQNTVGVITEHAAAVIVDKVVGLIIASSFSNSGWHCANSVSIRHISRGWLSFHDRVITLFAWPTMREAIITSSQRLPCRRRLVLKRRRPPYIRCYRRQAPDPSTPGRLQTTPPHNPRSKQTVGAILASSDSAQKTKGKSMTIPVTFIYALSCL